jgi:hypothetical protein
MRSVKVRILAAVAALFVAVLILVPTPSSAVRCGNIGGYDPCQVVCRIAARVHVNCIFGP